MSARLWLLEGLPGSGKTTAARRLHARCTGRGLPARWWLEEARDHPVLPADLRRRSADAAYDDLCLSAFKAFVARESGVLILEGSAFQSAVRFMFANDWSPVRIGDYLVAWQAAVAAAAPRLILFHVRDPRTHFTRLVEQVRGPEWLAKVTAYVERTPVARARGWAGPEGFLAFWSAYQDLCLEHAATLEFPIQIFEPWSETAAFDADGALAFLTGEVSYIDQASFCSTTR